MENQKTTSEEWKKQMSKFYGVMFECGDYEQLVDFISTLIAQKQKEVLDYLLSIHQKLESEYCGSITDIKLGIKSENPHTFVIEIIQTAKEKFNINL